MSNIIPPSINDRLNTMMDYIKYLYKAFQTFTQNFYVNSANNIVLNTNSINTPNIIQLNNNGTNIVNILYGTSAPLAVNHAPNGSLYLNNGNNGELYLRVDETWKKILTEN
jgi:hypothetical protein